MNDASIAEALASERFALVGAGQLGSMALDMWPSQLEPPRFFVDTFKTTRLRGIEVLPLEEHRPEPGTTYLLSAFKLPAETALQIFRRLEQPLLLTVYDLFEAKCPRVFSNGWRVLNPSDEKRARIAQTRACFSDARSVAAFDAACAWRYDRELRFDYPVDPEETKYDLSLLGREEAHYNIVYDCGTYDLGLAAELAASGVTFSRYVAFEADRGRLAKCEAWVDKLLPGRRHEVTLRGEAVCDEVGTATFLGTSLLSARLVYDNLQGDHRLAPVATTTLDAAHRALFPGASGSGASILIKLHVEGAEGAALRGARALIDSNRCDILLNLSHDESSLLDLPSYIAALGRHDLLLRSHSLFGEGLTLFARHKDTCS